MTGLTLPLRNFTRNRLRTLLTVLAIALPMFVFTAARSFVDGINRFLADSDRNLRVAVHQKLTFTTFLPQRVRQQIEELAPPGYLEGVCRTTWFGGRLEGVQGYFPNMAVDRDTFPVVYSEYEMTAEEIARFNEERRAAVIGKPVAKLLNVSVGDRVTLKGTVPPFAELEFLIAAIPRGLESPWLYFGLDYYDETFRNLTGRPVGVNNVWLKCSSPEARQWALTEIDKHFANTESETRTEMESTFTAAFIESQGDWVGLLWTIGQLIVVVAVAVAFNTMSMAFRERTGELALLRALGFSRPRVIATVLAEGLMLGLLGGLVAVVPMYLLTQVAPISIPGSSPLKISEGTALLGVAVGSACGLLAALVPALMSGRLAVAYTLRKVV